MKIKLYLLAILLLFLVFGYAQTPRVTDSLLSALKFSKEDTSKVNTLNRLAYELRGNDPDTSIYFANAALTLSMKLGYQTGIANANLYMGLTKTNLGKYNEALINSSIALKLYDSLIESGKKPEKTQLLKLKAQTYNSVGLTYLNQDRYPDALKNFFIGLKIREDVGDKKGMAASLNNIAIVYREQKNNSGALKIHLASLKIKEEIGDRQGMLSSYINIGTCYLDDHKYDEALKIFFSSLKLAEELGDQENIAFSYLNIGNAFHFKARYPDALKNYFSCLKIAKELRKPNTISNILLAIGKNYIQQKKFNEGYGYLNGSLSVAKEAGNLLNLMWIYQELADCEKAMGKYRIALEHFELSVVFRDSVFNEENTEKSVKTQLTYEFEKKEAATKAEQEKTDALALQEIKIQRNIRNSTFGGLAFVLFFSVVVYRQRNKIGRGKKRSDELVLEKEMLIKEIHHRVKNNLEVISSLLELQSHGIDDAKAKAAVTEGQNRVQSIALIHHKLYRDDDVSSVDFKSFANDLYKQVETVFKKPGTEINFHVKASETLIDNDAAVPLGMILNELLTNSFKYAVKKEKTNEISIELQPTTEKGFAKIIFRDNGPGLTPGFDIKTSSSLGMKVIQLLTKQMGGTLNFYYEHGSVFEISFRIAKELPIDSNTEKINLVLSQ
jgi:two-component sensor histidine kinase